MSRFNDLWADVDTAGPAKVSKESFDTIWDQVDAESQKPEPPEAPYSHHPEAEHVPEDKEAEAETLERIKQVPGVVKDRFVHGALSLPQSGGRSMEYAGHRIEKTAQQAPAVTQQRPGDVLGMLTATEQFAVGRRMEALREQNPEIPEDQLLGEAINAVQDENRQTLEKFGKGLSQFGKTGADYQAGIMEGYEGPPEIQGNVWDKPELLADPRWWTGGTAEMIPSLFAAIIPGIGTRNAVVRVGQKMIPATREAVANLGRFAKALGAVAGGTGGGGMEGMQTYEAVLKDTGNEQEAARAAEFMTGISSLLNSVGNMQMLDGIGKSFLAKAGYGALIEGLTEGAEEPGEVAAKIMAKIVEGEELPDNIWQMFVESFKEGITVAPIAGFTGMGGTVMGELSRPEIKPEDKTKEPSRAKKILDGTLDETEKGKKPVDIVDQPEEPPAPETPEEPPEEPPAPPAEPEPEPEPEPETPPEPPAEPEPPADEDDEAGQFSDEELDDAEGGEDIDTILDDIEKEIDEEGDKKEAEEGRNLAGGTFKHFTTADSKRALEKGEPFDFSKNPIHGTGSLDDGPKTGRFAGDNRLYLSLEDNLWGKTTRRKGKDEIVDVTADNTDELENKGAEFFYDYEQQKWRAKVGAKVTSENLEHVNYRLSEDAKIKVIDSHEAMKAASREVVAAPLNDGFWDKLAKKYDAVALMNVRKVADETDSKFFRAALGDQIIVLNPSKASIEKPAWASGAGQTPNVPHETGKRDTFLLHDNTPVEYDWAVAEADNLNASNTEDFYENPNYPADLQPRKRDREAMQIQVRKMAQNLAIKKLGSSPTPDPGAPIVGDDFMVEGGNGRTMAIKLAYSSGFADRYKKWIQKNAAEFGIDPERIAGMKKPVLVRKRATPVEDRVKFAEALNVAESASSGPLERALTDARGLDDADMAIFRPSDEGDLSAASNRAFVKRFISKMGVGQQNEWVNDKGNPTPALYDRVRNAVFHRAYQDKGLTQLVSEEADPEIRGVLSALTAAAPAWMKVRAKDDDMGGSELLTRIVEMANVIRRAKNRHPDKKTEVAVDAVLDQIDAFDEPYHELTDELARYVAKNIRKTKRLGEYFRLVAEGVSAYIEGTKQGDLFGGEPAPIDDLQLVKTALERLDEKYQDKQKDIFGDGGDKGDSPVGDGKGKPPERGGTSPGDAGTEEEGEKTHAEEQLERLKATGFAVGDEVRDANHGAYFGVIRQTKRGAIQVFKEKNGASWGFFDKKHKWEKADGEPATPPAENKIPPQWEEALEKLESDLMDKGAGWIRDPEKPIERHDFKILQHDTTEGFYFSKTFRGIREKTGGGGASQWTRGQAIERAMREARSIVEGGLAAFKEPEPSAETPDIGEPGNFNLPALARYFLPMIRSGEKLNKVKIQTKVAAALGVKKSDLTRNRKYSHKPVEEAVEYAIVLRAIEIISEGKPTRETYKALKELYDNQPSLSTRSSTSTRNQAYSTPVHLAYLMQKIAGVNNDSWVYEPTAGTGMLLTTAEESTVWANEINEDRQAILLDQNFMTSRHDGRSAVQGEKGKIDLTSTDPYPAVESFDAVLANPPFGTVATKKIDGYNISKLEHFIIIDALKAMKDDGKAVFIIGGHNFQDGKMHGPQQVFLNWLDRFYDVTANVDIPGDEYARQGTSFPVRMIVVQGRRRQDLGPNHTVPANENDPFYMKVDSVDDIFERFFFHDTDTVDTEGTAGLPGGAEGAGGDGAEGGEGGRGDVPVGVPPETAPTDREGGRSGGGDQDVSGADVNVADRPGRPGGRRPGEPGDGGRVDGTGGGSAPAPGEEGEPGERQEQPGPGPQGSGGGEQPEIPAGTGGTGSGNAPGVDDLLADIEREIDEEGDKRRQQEAEAQAEKDKTEAKAAMDKAVDDLNAILNDPNFSRQTTEEPTVADDDQKWLTVLPHLEKMWEASKGFANTIRERASVFIRTAYDKLSSKIRPYLKKFTNTRIKEAVDNAKTVEEVFNHDGFQQFKIDGEIYADRILQEQGLRPALLKVGDKIEFTPPEYKEVDGIPNAPKDLETETTDYQQTYQPKSGGNIIDETLVPVKMAQATAEALDTLEKDVGNIDEYVRTKLQYNDFEDLYKALSADQIDAVALGIWNMDKGAAIIVGDQTGVGKGRVAASLYKYGRLQGKRPVFFTAKPDLFSDFYRDIVDIGYGFDPFIMASDKGKARIVDANGDIVHDLEKDRPRRAKYRDIRDRGQEAIAPKDGIVTTYSQVNVPNVQQGALSAAFRDNIVILDESHKAGGDSNTGHFIRGALQHVNGAIYLSATFAKRPDTMPVYFRTDMSRANMTMDELIVAVESGGTPLQEILASALAKLGQYIRREKSFRGISVKTYTDSKNRTRDEGVSDSMTSVMRTILALDVKIAEEFKRALRRANNRRGGGPVTVWGIEIPGNQVVEGHRLNSTVERSSFAATAHNAVRQLLFCMKAETAVEQTLMDLRERSRIEEQKDGTFNIVDQDGRVVLEGLTEEGAKMSVAPEGRKPLIAVDNTMESFVDSLDIGPGDPFEPRYAMVLNTNLDRTMKITVKDPQGNGITYDINPDHPDFPRDLRDAYHEAKRKIRDGELGELTGSPIDYIKARLAKEGFRAEEITGRKKVADITDPDRMVLRERTGQERSDKKAILRAFNNGEIDALIVNRSAAEGVSAHASKSTGKDLRPRSFIGSQPQLNVDDEVQIMGRINRKGQVALPKYTQIALDIPAEIRPASVLSRKMKGLSANTSANADSPLSQKDFPDMDNRYGDRVTNAWLAANPTVAASMQVSDEAGFLKASGRVAMQPIGVQREFYEEIEAEYNDLIAELKELGMYDLEVQDIDYKAVTRRKDLMTSGNEKDHPLGGDTFREELEVVSPTKPYTRKRLEQILETRLSGAQGTPFYHGFDMQEEDRAGFMEMMIFVDKLGLDFDEYYAKKERDATAATSGNAYTAALDALANARSGWDETRSRIMSYNLGETYRVQMDGFPTMTGVLIDFKRSKGAGNPAAPSKIRLVFAVNNSLRRITVSLSKIANDSVALTYRDAWIPENWDEITAGEIRHTRFAFTGNLLQGFGQAPTGSRIVRFTRRGEEGWHEGILLPMNYVPDIQNEKVRININQAAQIHGQGYPLSGETVNITDDGVITVPRGAQEFYQDETLLSLLDRDFETVGDRFVSYITRGKERQVIERIYSLGDAFSIDRPLFDTIFGTADQQTADSLDQPNFSRRGASERQQNYTYTEIPEEPIKPRLGEPQQLELPLSGTQIELPFGKPEPKTAEPAGKTSDLFDTRRQRIVVRTSHHIAFESAVVRGPDDAASLIAHIRKEAQENAYGIAVDRRGNVLEVMHLGKGTASDVSVGPIIAAGRAMNLDGVHKYYFIHNHPAGSTKPSPEDWMLSHSLGGLLDFAGIDYENIIIGGEAYSHYDRHLDPQDLHAVPSFVIRPSIRRAKIPVKKRVIAKRAGGLELTHPDHARPILEKEYGNAPGFLMLNGKNQVAGFIPYPKGKTAKEAAAQFVAFAEATGARAAVFNSPDVDIFKTPSRLEFFKELRNSLAGLMTFHEVLNGPTAIAATSGMDATFGAIPRDATGVLNLRDLGMSAIESLAGPLYRKRNTKAYNRKRAADIEAELADELSRWKPGPEVAVVQHQADLPRVILDAAKDGDLIDGVHFQGTIYIVADNIRSANHARRVLLHEGFHFGIRAMLGEDIRPILRDVYIAKRKECQDIAAKERFDLKTDLGRMLAADEWLAREAENEPESGWTNRLIATIRNWIRKVFPGLKMSDGEIRELIAAARRHVRGERRQRGGGAGFGLQAQPAFMYAGQKAQTADKSALQRAVEMEQAGEDAEAIRKETGWFLGMDGKYRYEIDDSKTKLSAEFLNRKRSKKYKLVDILDHPNFFEAYPDAKNISVSIEPLSRAIGEMAGSKMFISTSLLPEQKERTVLHELQHWVQTTEGFASGGDVGTVIEEAEFNNEGYDLAQHIIGAIYAKFPPGNALHSLSTEERIEWFIENRRKRLTREKSREIADFVLSFPNADKARKAVEKASRNKKITRVEQYERLAGEIEARDTSARKDLDAAQRRGTTPYVGQGIPKEDAIVRFSSGGESAIQASMTKGWGKADIPTAESPKAEGGVTKKQRFAYEAYANNEVPDGWYVHGRADSKELDTGYPLQLTTDWDVADQYGGSEGSKWLIRPNNNASTLDLSDQYSDDMDKIVSAAVEDYNKGKLNFSEWVEGANGVDVGEASDENIEDAVRESFAPEDIVTSAGAYDNSDFVDWLMNRFDVDFVKTPDGAVLLNTEAAESIRVPETLPNPSRQTGESGTEPQFSRRRPGSDIKVDTEGALPEEVEKRMAAARGNPRTPLWDKIKEVASEFARQRQHFPDLETIPDKKLRGRLADILRIHQEIPETARNEAAVKIKDWIEGLSKDEYEAFRMHIILADMMRDIRDGLTYDGKLPFGFETVDQVEHAMDRYEQIAKDYPKVGAALKRRNDTVNDIKKKLVKEKLLKKEVLEKEDYFHHQVIQYWTDKYGLSTGSGDVRTHWRPWQAARKGSPLDYNTEYIEAEFMAISQQLAQLATVETLKRIKKEADIYDQTKRNAKAENVARVWDILREQGKIETYPPDHPTRAGEEIDPLLPYKQKIAMSTQNLAKMAASGKLEYDSEWQDLIDFMAQALAKFKSDRAAWREAVDGDPKVSLTIDHPRFFHFLSYLINTKKPGANWAATIYKAIRERDAFIKDTLGEEFKTFRSMIPEGYTVWKPDPNKGWYWANTVADNVLQRIIEGEIDLRDEDVRKVLAKGRDLIWVIPEGLAKTLDGFYPPAESRIVGRVSEASMKFWKQYILINPFSLFKYNLNNMSGDLDAVLAYCPGILKYGIKAGMDLAKWQRRRKLPAEVQAEIDQARKLGVVGSGFAVQEVEDILRVMSMDAFVRDVIMDEKPNWFNPVTVGRNYWSLAKGVTVWRENILRLAAWRYFKDNADKKLYGGSSRPWEIDAIEKPEEKAAKLARELLGDYGNISQTGEWIRKHLMPFYAWLEINAPRYVYMMRNTKYENRSAGSAVGRAAAVGGKKVVLEAGKMALRASMLMGAVLLWNMTVFPDEEEELGEAGRRQLHIILGRREDGTIITLRFQGALSDALSFFGLEDWPDDIKDVAQGKQTVLDKLKDATLALLNRAVHSIRPDATMMGEVISGRKFYPEVTRPMPIRDTAEHVLKLFKLDHVYDYIAGKPKRGNTVAEHMAHDLAQLFVYESDPGEQAYYDTRKMVFDWLAKQGDERPSATPTKRGNALYYYRRALKFGDLQAAEKYLEKYYEMGGRPKYLKKSIEMAHPLSSISKSKRLRFRQSLKPDQEETLGRALDWYHTTYGK